MQEVKSSLGRADATAKVMQGREKDTTGGGRKGKVFCGGGGGGGQTRIEAKGESEIGNTY